jgi:hypothetical protein
MQTPADHLGGTQGTDDRPMENATSTDETKAMG